MENWLSLKLLSQNGIQKMNEVGYLSFLVVLIVSLIFSLFVSHLYVRFYGQKGVGSSIHRAFPLLGVSITAIFISLQFSIPLSLGLLGALSIVRFRTPIKDPEEIGFLLLLIASSLSCATFNLPFLSILGLVALIGLIILQKDLKLFRRHHKSGMITFTIPQVVFDRPELEKNILSLIEKSPFKKMQIDAILNQNNLVVINGSFSSATVEQVSDLKTKLRQIDQAISINTYFNASFE
jgi:hypothetical protein